MQRLPMISAKDIQYLLHSFRDLDNLQSENILDPIDPFTYVGFGGDTCLHYAAFRGDLRAIELLICGGVDINARGDMGATPLHSAHQAGKTEVITFLLSKGADPEIKDEFGRKPAEWVG